jgi:hypothetical protein
MQTRNRRFVMRGLKQLPAGSTSALTDSPTDLEKCRKDEIVIGYHENCMRGHEAGPPLRPSF